MEIYFPSAGVHVRDNCDLKYGAYQGDLKSRDQNYDVKNLLTTIAFQQEKYQLISLGKE